MESGIVVMGDLVASSSLAARERHELQSTFMRWLDELETKLAAAAGTRASITAGDAFQIVVTDPEAITEILWHEWELPEGVELRLGVGRGRIFTAHNTDSRLMDGPAFHLAREAVSGDGCRIVFLGFSRAGDTVLTGLAGLMAAHIEGLTRKQRGVLQLLHKGKTHKQVAELLGITRQAVSRFARVSRWDAFQGAETALSAALRHFDEVPADGGGDF